MVFDAMETEHLLVAEGHTARAIVTSEKELHLEEFEEADADWFWVQEGEDVPK